MMIEGGRGILSSTFAVLAPSRSGDSRAGTRCAEKERQSYLVVMSLVDRKALDANASSSSLMRIRSTVVLATSCSNINLHSVMSTKYEHKEMTSMRKPFSCFI